GLVGVDYFSYWNTPASEEEDRLLSNILKELDEMIGYEVNRQTLVTDLASWTDDYVITGMQVGDYKVWRFTTNNVVTTLDDSGDNVMFTLDDATVTFPEAMIYEPSDPVSPIGYWVIQRADAPDPIIS